MCKTNVAAIIENENDFLLKGSSFCSPTVLRCYICGNLSSVSSTLFNHLLALRQKPIQFSSRNNNNNSETAIFNFETLIISI